jgi:hypothetical protein
MRRELMGKFKYSRGVRAMQGGARVSGTDYDASGPWNLYRTQNEQLCTYEPSKFRQHYPCRAPAASTSKAIVADITPTLRANLAKEANLMTDEHASYTEVGGKFASHETVNHCNEQYVRYWTKSQQLRPDGSPLSKRPSSPPTLMKVSFWSYAA